jgi:hypothetical protein
MKRYYLYILTFICTQLSFGCVSTVWAKADCELKQLVTADEFKMLQENWKITPLLSTVEKDYSQLKSDEIYFYDTKSLLFKEKAILRWRKNDGKFTIKDRVGAKDQEGAKCQDDYTSKNKSKKSCQFDNNSPGPLPKQIQFSKDQKQFFKDHGLEWESCEIVTLGPINSYKSEVVSSVCQGLDTKKPIEFESWLLKDNKHSQMLFEISVKVDGNSKECEIANNTFRDCIHKLGVDVDSDKGTKTEAVYTFFGN